MSGTVMKVIGWLGLLMLVAFAVLREKPVRQPDGELVSQVPIQRDLPGESQLHNIGPWQLTALADYEITARVLRAERYIFDDVSNLAPVDLVLGWQQMSDNKMLADIDFSQSGRWYYVNSKRTDISIADIMRQSANTHMIPAGRKIREVLLKVKAGHIIKAEGRLVEVISEGREPWSSSLRRDDDGDGACEIFYVTSIQVFGAQKDGEPVPLFTARQADDFKQDDASPRRIEPTPSPAAENSSTLAFQADVSASSVNTEVVLAERRALREEALSVDGSVDYFLASMTVNGLGPRGAVINGQFCRINEMIDYDTGLRLVSVDPRQSQLQFRDDSGHTYRFDVRVE